MTAMQSLPERNALAPGRTSIGARALFLGERIDLKAPELSERLASTPVTIPAGKNGLAVLFRYGAVVAFDLTRAEESALVEHLRPTVAAPAGRTFTEEVELRIDASVDDRPVDGVVQLREASLDRLQIVGEILARSVVLDHYETVIAGAFDRIEPLAAVLEQKGHGGRGARELLRHIGSALLIQHKMVGRVEIAEKPEILWERPQLELLYARLETEYEIRDRHTALERKLDLISRTVETLIELSQHDRSLRVEWYIVALICVEILLSLYEMFVRPA